MSHKGTVRPPACQVDARKKHKPLLYLSAEGGQSRGKSAAQAARTGDGLARASAHDRIIEKAYGGRGLEFIRCGIACIRLRGWLQLRSLEGVRPLGWGEVVPRTRPSAGSSNTSSIQPFLKQRLAATLRPLRGMKSAGSTIPEGLEHCQSDGSTTASPIAIRL